MNLLKLNFFPLSLVLLSFVGCTDLLDVEYSEKEMKIVNECSSEQLDNKKDIEESLIGRWKFIAYSCLTCSSNDEFDIPDIEFFEDFTAQAIAGEIDIQYSWEVIESGSGPDVQFSIEVTPGSFNIDNINIICPKYMINEGSSIIYIYEKQ